METQTAVAFEPIEEALDPWALNQCKPVTMAPAALSVQSYCRSKTFIARSGVNPLVATASALFSLIAKLRQAKSYENLNQLQSDLVHEVKAFECAAIGRHYDTEQIVVARYVMCATLDETILRTAWGLARNWQQYSLVAAFKEDAATGEKVFALLERLRQTPTAYVDLLEFFYLCLSLGFEGKYRIIDNGRQALDSLLDDLYRIIRRERGDVSAPLVVSSQARMMQADNQSIGLPLKSILTTAAIILTVVYTSFVMMLHIEVQPVSQLMAAVTTNQ